MDRLEVATRICAGVLAGLAQRERAILAEAIATMSLQVADELILLHEVTDATFQARRADARRGFPLFDPKR